jgi:hypothetical protein
VLDEVLEVRRGAEALVTEAAACGHGLQDAARRPRVPSILASRAHAPDDRPVAFFQAALRASAYLRGVKEERHPMRRSRTIAVIALAFAPHALAETPTRKETTMTLHAKGPFDVKVLPQPADEKVGHEQIGRMGLDKKFHGDLEAVSLGQMLAFMGGAKDSGSYVAVERVDGTLGGKKGTFALHHLGIMDKGAQNLTIGVVPGSATGELAGLTGSMKIIIAPGGAHSYELDYALPTP